MVFGGTKEANVDILIGEHVGLVYETVSLVEKLFEVYFKRDLKYRRLCKKIHKLEHEADKKRRQIEQALHEGAFMAMFREDFISLAEAIDKIANKSEAIADTLTLEHPVIPSVWHDSFLALAKSGAEACKPFTSLGVLLDRDMDEIKELSSEIEAIEQQADTIEWKLLEQIFASEEDLALKLQLRNLVRRLAALSDLAEDASDILDVLVIKRRL